MFPANVPAILKIRAKRLKIRGIYLLYRILQALGCPLILLYFLFRGFSDRAYWSTLPERFGRLPRSFRQTGPGAIWLHAVSVGEVLACAEFLRHLRSQLPNAPIFVSVSTLAGRGTAVAKLGNLATGVFYAPIDYVFVVRRVLRALKPSVVVVAETEIWPNLFRETKRIRAGLLLVNGRISDRAFPRYRRFAWLFAAALSAVDVILAQSEEMRARFVAIGAPSERVYAAGNFKYDFEARAASPASPVRRLIDRIQPRHVWIAASTMPSGEDESVLAAFGELARGNPGLLLILAPRKPPTFDDTAAKLVGIPHVRRSALVEGSTLALPGVLLLDSIGELSGLFAFADVVFMGGTLVNTGGHNILEPALFGKPVIVGPHMENFTAIAEDFRAARASVEISSASELAGAVSRLLGSPEEAHSLGERARVAAESKRGASARAAEIVCESYRAGLPSFRPALPVILFGWPLRELWLLGAGLKRKAPRKLDAFTISVGNLSMGGTGKTPCVLRVAAMLAARGAKPGILTRGYGRVSHEKVLALAPGAKVPAYHTGDEPQIFLRSGIAPVGIGADRFAVGLELQRKFHCDAMVLDDGFQHTALARDVDIVLVDALDPLGGAGVFPLGRLREPFSAIARAQIVLITRAEFTDLAPAIERTIRRWNPEAPVFRADFAPSVWVNAITGETRPPAAPPFQRAGAFCALGNPQSFRRTLTHLGVEPAGWVEFEDHHRYRARELVRMVHQFRLQGADAMVTTEKDAVNLPEMTYEMPVYFLRVVMKLDREAEFLDALKMYFTK